MTTPRPAGLVVADASRLHAEALALVLSSRGHKVHATATTWSGLLRAVSESRPGICVIDLHVLDGRAFDAIKLLHACDPETKIVILSRAMEPGSATSAVEAGVVGYLGKDKGIDQLIRALRRVEAGGLFIEPTLAQEVLRRVRRHADGAEPLRWLTQREREVLRRLTEGDDTTEIARELSMTTNTARTHVQNVLDKLGVHSRLEAIALAHQMGAEQRID